MLVNHHQRTLVPCDATDNGTTLLVTTLFGRRTDTPLESQPFETLFEDHVDNATDGIRTIEGGATIQVHFHPLNRRHGDGVEVDGSTTHSR